MNRFTKHLLGLLVAFASLTVAQAQQDWKLLVGGDLDVYFDNREYADSPIGESQTLFSSRLTPKVGIQWNEKNSLVTAVDIWSNFGENTKFFDKARAQVYYRFNSKKVSAYAGIFSRDEMLGDYSEAIPAFICVLLMPLTYSISDGIVLGHLSYVLINLLSGKRKRKKLSLGMFILALVFVLKFLV